MKHCHGEEAARKLPAAVAARTPFGQIKTHVLGDQRIIVVPGQLIQIPVGYTAHDFFHEFAKETLGREWGTAELAKAATERHPLVQWCHVSATQMVASRSGIPDGKVVATIPNGASAAFHQFGFHLFTMANAGLLTGAFARRLRDPLQFAGALREVYVYSLFLRSGFQLQPEDETSRVSRHGEFTATYGPANEAYWVEVKGRQRQGLLGLPGDRKPDDEIQLDFGHLLSDALGKPTSLPRIVFIDVNVPPDDRDEAIPIWFPSLRRIIEKKELQRLAGGSNLPSCHLFLMNRPYHYADNEPAPVTRLIATGFRIPGYRQLPLEERKRRYPAIIALMECANASGAVPHRFPK